jgi:nitrilase
MVPATLRQACANGAPCGLPQGPDRRLSQSASFGAPIGPRKPEGRAALARHHAGAIDLDGPEVACMTQASTETGAVAIIGVIERDTSMLHRTVLGHRDLVGKYRKRMSTAGARLIWVFRDGSTLPVFWTELGTLGAVICWETTCPPCACRCITRGSACIARPPAMAATH